MQRQQTLLISKTICLFIHRPRSRGGGYCHHQADRAVMRPRVASGQYLGNRKSSCFHIAYTHRLGGVDVPFDGYDLWSNFGLRFSGVYSLYWWPNEWMNEWINEWMNEWMNEWSIIIQFYNFLDTSDEETAEVKVRLSSEWPPAGKTEPHINICHWKPW